MTEHDIISRMAAEILGGTSAGLPIHGLGLDDVQQAVSLAFAIRQEVIVQTRARREKAERAESTVERVYPGHAPLTFPAERRTGANIHGWLGPDRRRPFGGWDTQEQQDADEGHRRTERRAGNRRAVDRNTLERRTPGTVEVDPARGWVPTVPPEPGRSLDSLDPRD